MRIVVVKWHLENEVKVKDIEQDGIDETWDVRRL